MTLVPLMVYLHKIDEVPSDLTFKKLCLSVHNWSGAENMDMYQTCETASRPRMLSKPVSVSFTPAIPTAVTNDNIKNISIIKI
jgi:hypothetical protein